MKELVFEITTFEDLKEFAADFKNYLKKDTLVGLRGDLGAGKTTFVKELLKSMGVKENVISPTYLYEQEYVIANEVNGIKTIRHLDLYRIKGDEDLGALGLDLGVGDLVLIEWIENSPQALKLAKIMLDFYIKNNKRFISVNYGK